MNYPILDKIKNPKDLKKFSLNGLKNLYHPKFYYDELQNAYKTENN